MIKIENFTSKFKRHKWCRKGVETSLFIVKLSLGDHMVLRTTQIHGPLGLHPLLEVEKGLLRSEKCCQNYQKIARSAQAFSSYNTSRSQLSLKPIKVHLLPTSGEKVVILVNKSNIFRRKFPTSKTHEIFPLN